MTASPDSVPASTHNATVEGMANICCHVWCTERTDRMSAAFAVTRTMNAKARASSVAMFARRPHM